MNVSMTKTEFEELPLRDDWEGDYIEGAYYRAKTYNSTLFLWMTKPEYRSAPEWWAFPVIFIEEKEKE